MKILGRLFAKRTSADIDLNALQKQLFDASAAGDRTKFEGLCRQHADRILKAFSGWSRAPGSIRRNQESLQQYANTVIEIAQFFQEGLGKSELLEQLKGSDESNPISQWQDSLRRVDTLIEQRRYREGADVLQHLLAEIERFQGRAVAEYLPFAFGRLGTCHFHLGDCEFARSAVEKALLLCEQNNDVEGIITYLRNLFELFRYTGDTGAAVTLAVRLTGIFEQSGDGAGAQFWRGKADVLNRGEPLSRVIAYLNDDRYELEAVPARPSGDAHLKFVFQRNRESLGASVVLVEKGRQLGSACKYEEALETFQEAAGIDQYSPDPHYEAAITLMHLRRYPEAVDAYGRVESLAPGWYHCRSEMWLARHLATGHITHETFLTLRELEDGNSLPLDKAQIAEAALQQAPAVALLYLRYGENLKHLGDREEAEAVYRKGLRFADDQTCRLVCWCGWLDYLIQGIQSGNAYSSKVQPSTET